MRRAVIILALALSACAAPKRVEEHTSYERRDTLRAILGEELTVCLDDVRIIPPDTVQPRLEAARVRLERRVEAAVEATAVQAEQAETKQLPQPAVAPGKWLYALVAAGGFLVGIWVARR